jgi:hypothetical protein
MLPGTRQQRNLMLHLQRDQGDNAKMQEVDLNRWLSLLAYSKRRLKGCLEKIAYMNESKEI